MTIEVISLGEIVEDHSLQIREDIDGSMVDKYQALMKSNGPLGSLDVFSTGNGKYLLADGWHRLAAAKALGWPEIKCNVRKGGRRDAVLFAAGANAEHGRPLNRQEKTTAVEKLLEDEEWFQWSNARIARHCGVTAPTVARTRDRFINESAKQESSRPAGSSGGIKKSLIDNEKRKRSDKHGNVVKFNPAKGRTPKSQEEKNLADLNSALNILATLRRLSRGS